MNIVWVQILLKPQVDSPLFAAVLLLRPIQIEEVDPVFHLRGLSLKMGHVAPKMVRKSRKYFFAPYRKLFVIKT